MRRYAKTTTSLDQACPFFMHWSSFLVPGSLSWSSFLYLTVGDTDAKNGLVVCVKRFGILWLYWLHTLLDESKISLGRCFSVGETRHGPRHHVLHMISRLSWSWLLDLCRGLSLGVRRGLGSSILAWNAWWAAKIRPIFVDKAQNHAKNQNVGDTLDETLITLRFIKKTEDRM